MGMKTQVVQVGLECRNQENDLMAEELEKKKK